ALLCQIGNPNGEQENHGHEREPEQETIDAAWIVPKLLSLPRIRRTHWFVGHGDFSAWPLTWAGSHKKSRERHKPRYRFRINKKTSGGTDKKRPLSLAEKRRQLGDVARNAPRLVHGQHLRNISIGFCLSPIDVCEIGR